MTRTKHTSTAIPHTGFESTYTRLNPAQKQAVDAIEGPVMVMAGPGTGKTQVISARIANILRKTDTNPHNILALTFTDSAAKNMRERLVSMIGRTGYYVHIKTFHAFCNEVIKEFPEYFPLDRDATSLTELDRYQLYEDLIKSLSLESLKPPHAPFFYLYDIIKAISDLKREGVLVRDLKKILENNERELNQSEEGTKSQRQAKKKALAKQKDLLLLYTAYQQRLEAGKQYDFDDMISLVVESLHNQESLLQHYQENLQYFLVDEYQDTNNAQNNVIDTLASYWGDAANIFVVGDPNQAIYRFQGASTENMLAFIKRYPSSQVINLNIGYRGVPSLYTLAAGIIAHNLLTQSVPVFSALKNPIQSARPQTSQPAVIVQSAPSQILETVYIAEEINRLINSGISGSDIAVLYRHNKDAAQISETLEKWGIRYEIDSGNNVLEQEHIRQLINLFTVICEIRQGKAADGLFEVFRYPWTPVNSLIAFQLGRIAGKAKQSMFDITQVDFTRMKTISPDTKLTVLEFTQVTAFVDQLKQWGLKDQTMVFTQWFAQVVKESGYLDWLLIQPNKIDLLNHLNSLFREVKLFCSKDKAFNVASFLQALKTMTQHQLKINVEDLNITTNAVRLATVHKAKGQEWKYVFLLHVIDGKWGNNYTREMIPLPAGLLQFTDTDKKEKNEDERRLFYVAVTRAKDKIYLSYPESIIEGNYSKDVTRSMFIEEMIETMQENHLALTHGDQDKYAANIDGHLATLLSPATAYQPTPTETEFFRGVIKDFKLSVTALNTYLRDPKEFIYNTLLRIPRAKADHMSFGTAIHRTLESTFKHVQKKLRLPKLEKVLSDYETFLRQEIVTQDFITDRILYGQKLLTAYYHDLSEQTINPVHVERFFGSGWSKTILDDIPLSGRIDRIDWVNQNENTVRVIDYKTGSPKTDNFIEGTIASANLSAREAALPKSIRGPLKRQLLFYKLLGDLDPTFRPTITEGVFEYIEGYKEGKNIIRRFELKPADAEDLKDLVREVMKELRELQFLKYL